MNDETGSRSGVGTVRFSRLAAALLAGLTVAAAFLVLVPAAGDGLDRLQTRADRERPSGIEEHLVLVCLEEHLVLVCLEDQIGQAVRGGEAMWLDVGGDEYLWQRTAELSFGQI